LQILHDGTADRIALVPDERMIRLSYNRRDQEEVDRAILAARIMMRRRRPRAN
jgi:hypothetical protein